MLNAVCDLPFAEQPELEPSDAGPPKDCYAPFYDLLREMGYSRTEVEPDRGDHWRREYWKNGSRCVRLAINDKGSPFGLWSRNEYGGPIHKDCDVSLRVLRLVLES